MTLDASELKSEEPQQCTHSHIPTPTTATAKEEAAYGYDSYAAEPEDAENDEEMDIEGLY
jgi:hypothetical protein